MTGLQGKRLYLRPAAPGDEEVIFSWENDPGLWSFTDTPGPVSMEEIRDFLNQPFNDIHSREQLRLMICLAEDDRVIGAIDLYEFSERQGRCGVGINISQDARRQGFAAEALGLVIAYARETLRLRQLWCTIPESNEASIRLFRKHGFSRSGLLREWLEGDEGGMQDVIFLQCMLG